MKYHASQQHTQHSQKTSFVLGVLGIVLLSTLSLLMVFSPANAAPNYQMNYQGKLTNASNVAVANGTYNMRFWLLTTSSIATTSAVWTESLTGTNKVQVTNGLFSVMLGSTSPLTSVDFNQTLYLGVEIGGTSTPGWDGEMSPRKVLGTVPAAFEADKLDGLTSTQFVRTDATTTIATSSPETVLTITQNGVGDILNLFDGSVKVFSVIDGGNVGIGTTTPSRKLTVQGGDAWFGGNLTATGTATFANLLGTGSSTIGGGTGATGLTINGTATTTNLKITSLTASRALFTDANNLLTTTGLSQYLIDSLSDETGTGSLVFSTDPLLAGFRSSASSTIGDGTATGGLTINGNSTTTGNAYFASSIGIGTTSPMAALSIATGQVVIPNGGSAAPSLSFAAESNNGIYRPNTNVFGIAINGGGRFAVNASNFAYTSSNGLFGFTSGTGLSGSIDTNISRVSAGVLGVGTGAQGSVAGTLLAGTVGIGTSTLSTKLTVWGGDSSSTTRLTNFVNSASTSLFTIFNDGKVGVGSSTPSRTLTVDGDIFTPNNISAGSSTITYASSTGLTATNATFTGATSSSLYATTLGLNSEYFTDLTGSGLSNTTNALTCITSNSSTFGCLTAADWTIFNNKVSSTSIDTSAELASLLTDETGSAGNLVFSGNPLLAGFRSSASSTIGDGTGAGGLTINGTATTTNLKITSLTASRALFTDANNLLTTTGVSQYLIDSLSDETGTGSLVFSTNPLLAGFRSSASSTIGGGTDTSGLTINGGATTTGKAYFGGNVGIATTTPGFALTIGNGQIAVPDGTAGAPSYSFINDPDSGLLSSGADAVSIFVGGSVGLYVNASGFRFASGRNFADSGTGNAFLKFTNTNAVANSASNYFEIFNAATGTATTTGRPIFASAGSDTNIDMVFSPKGTGQVGIGSTTPSRFLTVSGGDAWFSNNITAASSTITYASSTGLTATNATFTGATTSSLYATTLGLNSEYFTDLTGSGLSNTSNALTCITSNSSTFGCLTGADWTIFNNKISSTSIDTSAELATLLTDETGTAGNVVFSGNPLLAGFRSNASSTIGDGTATGGLTINGTATTTNLKITSLTASRALFTDANNLLTTTGVSQYLIDSLSDETGTGSLVFSTNPLLAGFRSSASSTIGGGTDTTGLTINGGATTTGKAYFGGLLGIGTTTPSATLAVVGSGTTDLFRFASSSGSAMLSLDSRGVLTFGTSTTADIFINGGPTTQNPQQNGNNVAIGNSAFIYASTTSSAQYNIAIGANALLGSSTIPMTGDHNIAIGTQALANNASGTNNIAIGSLSLTNNSTGYSNTAVGYSSQNANTTGFQNVALGYASLLSNTIGTDNTGSGWGSLALNISGIQNSAFGSQAMLSSTGSYNTAQGYKALASSGSGDANTASGWQSLVSNTSGTGNTGIGYNALFANTTGTFNTALGIIAGITNTTGSSNTFLGYGADASGSGFASSTAIGTKATVGCSNCMVLGGTGINYANVGIGTTTPTALLTIGTTTVTGARVAGIKQYFGFVNSVQDAVYYGNETYITNVPTATSTLVGSMIRIADTSTLGNTVRGFEAQAYRGTNTKGENTGLSGFGRTFGVRGTTLGDAGDTYLPAGVFAETQGTTQGSALRAYSGTITTAGLVSLFHDTSNFIGTGLQMNFGNAGGSFAATSSAKFLDLQVAGTSKFIVAANGSTTIGDGVTSASLRIPFGGICVDNDGSCVSTTTGQIRSVTSVLGNSDLAEMYFSNQSLHAGEIIALSGGLSIKRAEEDTKEHIIGVVSTKPGLTLGFDDTSLIVGEHAYPVGLKGRVPIKLSTENGPIKKGDRIALSSIPGVGMKATESGRVVGIALEDYDGTRAYTEGFLNQFGDDMYKERMVVTQTIDPRSQDGCSYGGGHALGEEACIAQKVKKMKVVAPKIDTTREDILRAFAQESALQTTFANGDVAYVGQALMFIELTSYHIAGESRVLSELASSTLLLNGTEGETIWSRLKTLAQNFVNGVLTVTGIKADRVEVKNELCVDGVCVTADDLRAILQNAHKGSQHAPPQNNTGGGGGAVSIDPGTSSPAPSTEGNTGGGGNTTESPPGVTEESPPETVPTTESPPPEPAPTPPSPSPEPPAPEPPPI